MTNDELQDLSKQLVEAVANRCHHIIHDDDPIMTVAVILQEIASNTNIQQAKMLDVFTKSVLAGALDVQMAVEKTPDAMQKKLSGQLAIEIGDTVTRTMGEGKIVLQDLIRSETENARMALRTENTTIRHLRQTAQFAFAASLLSFLGGLAIFIAIAIRSSQ